MPDDTVPGTETEISAGFRATMRYDPRQRDWLVVRAEAEPGTERGDPAAQAARRLVAYVELAARLSQLHERLRLSADELLDVLTAVADTTPADAEDPAASLSEHDEAVLRAAGSLRYAMPPLAERASTRTGLAAARLLVDSLTVKQVADRLHVTPGRIRQRLAGRTLLGVSDHGSWRLPAFQFTDDGGLPGLEVVLPAFPADVHPLAVQRFLDAPHHDLEIDGEPVSPRQWLETGGDPHLVAELAAAAYVTA
jgi:hypothetical protein